MKLDPPGSNFDQRYGGRQDEVGRFKPPGNSNTGIQTWHYTVLIPGSWQEIDTWYTPMVQISDEEATAGILHSSYMESIPATGHSKLEKVQKGAAKDYLWLQRFL